MVDDSWLKVSLTLDGELAEAVAEVLDRFVSNGVVIESKVRQKDDAETGVPAESVHVSGYIFIDETIEQKKARIEEALWHLGQIQPIPPARYRIIRSKDWMTSWKKHYHPIQIGKRLEILPAWSKHETPGRIAVRIDPGMAFGTGTHPSTQLCLEHLEQFVIPGQPIIDVGCGSGILSIAALKLGASHVLAVDIDSAAIRNTEVNAKTNGVWDKMEVGCGSVAEILVGKHSLRQAPVVVVNILAPVIAQLLKDGLARLVKDKGCLILAGILDTQFPLVDEQARTVKLSLVDRTNKNDWISPVYKK